MRYSVLSRSVLIQPDSPEVGDEYLVPPAATGADWGGMDNRVGIYLESGWHFRLPPIGFLLYVEDTKGYCHRDDRGAWIDGLGSIVLGPGSIPITSVLGANASFVIKVENQTTNAPPYSPVAPSAYIIGPSPTGPWAGQAGRLAMCLIDDEFTVISPQEGDEVWDKDLNINVRFNGTAWVSSVGAVIGFTRVSTAASVPTGFFSGSYYGYSAAVPPRTTNATRIDPVKLTVTAKTSGSKLRFRYSAGYAFTIDAAAGTTGSPTLALFRDSEVNAVEWRAFTSFNQVSNGFQPLSIDREFIIDAIDSTPHTYTLGMTYGGDGAGGSAQELWMSSIHKRDFSCMEMVS